MGVNAGNTSPDYENIKFVRFGKQYLIGSF